MQNFGQVVPREREGVFKTINVIARSEATRQSVSPHKEGGLLRYARNDVDRPGDDGWAV